MRKQQLIIGTVLICLLAVFVLWPRLSQRQAVPSPLQSGVRQYLPSSSLRFLAVGDTGSGSKHQKDVAGSMARYAARFSGADTVQCVLMLGDNFYENGVKGTDDPQWQTKFEQIYNPQQLPMPFVAVLGNHDWRYDPVAQIQYAKANPGTRWQMDGFWFKRQYFTGTNRGTPLVDFFFIDTDLWNYGLGKLADKQLDWLSDGLQSSRARWQIVVGHHPMYSNGEHGKDSDVQKIRDLLSPLFRKYGVDAYLSGHDHDLQRIEIPTHPTTFIISGAGGQLRPRKFDEWKPFYSSTAGFAAITLTESQMTGQFLDAGGKVLNEWKRAPK